MKIARKNSNSRYFMEQTFNFDEIRPYEGEEVAAAAERLCKEELFCKAIAYVVPDTEAFLHTLSVLYLHIQSPGYHARLGFSQCRVAC